MHVITFRICFSCLLIFQPFQILSMLWSGTGFYVNVKLKEQKKVLDVHAIMTNYHVYLEMKQYDTDMVAVFHYEDAGKSSSEIPLAPLKLFAHSEVQ